MADIQDPDEIDRTETAFGDEDDDFPYDDLRKMLAGDPSDAGPESAFGDEPDDAARTETVGVDEGLGLIDKAKDDAAKAAKIKLEADTPDGDGADGDTGNDASGKAVEATPAPSDIETLLADIPEDRREAIKARVALADEVGAVFKGRDADLKKLDMKPAQAVARLVRIHDYAMRDPTEYAAWFASQFGDPAEVLTKAAEKLGMKLVKEDSGDDDDPFEDPEIKALREENRRLKGEDRPRIVGPDDPALDAQAQLRAFAAEAPLLEVLGPTIAQKATQHIQATGRPATIEDIRRFYAEAEADVRRRMGVDSTPAAQSQQPVADKGQKAAQGVSRAKAASMSIDGQGHGANRRPGPAEGASIEDVIRHQMSLQG